MLVSIVVVTYNSAVYLEECLESIKKQSYNELELIVTDDCSKDDTIRIAKDWIERNKDRFKAAIVLESQNNTGVAGNCNRGLDAAKGKWAKFIAGDDLLANERSIETYVSSIPLNKNIGTLFSDIYQLKSGETKLISCRNKDIMFGDGVGANEQYKILIKENFIPAISAFLYLPAIKAVGGYDESIPMCEDGVLWINLTKKGYLLSYINIPLVIYRIHSGSLVGQFHNKINIRLLEDQIKVLERFKIPGHRGLWRIHFRWLKLILVAVCRISEKHIGLSKVLMFIYRLSLHSANLMYFKYVRKKKIEQGEKI